MQVASGRFVREEVIANLVASVPNGQGRLLQPKEQEGVAYFRTQAQGHHHELSPSQAVVQSIARGDMTPRQKQAFEELNRRGVSLPSGLQAIQAAHERMERARHRIFGDPDQNQRAQRQRQQARHGQQSQGRENQQRNRHQDRRRNQQQSHHNQQRRGPHR